MGSRKRSAMRRQMEEFRSQLGGMDDAFERAQASHVNLDDRRDAARRARGCERKQRYQTRWDAQEAIALCAEHGRSGLRCYRCEYCGGWHLTSRKG
jgi:hypothetical protein